MFKFIIALTKKKKVKESFSGGGVPIGAGQNAPSCERALASLVALQVVVVALICRIAPAVQSGVAQRHLSLVREASQVAKESFPGGGAKRRRKMRQLSSARWQA